MYLLLFFVIAVLLTIFLSFFLKTNPGFLATIFAMLVGILGCGLSVGGVIALWPAKLMMTLVFMTYFFGFATNNGTMEAMVLHIAWWARKCPALLPVVLYAVACILSAIGLPAYALFVFLAGIVFPICINCGINILIGAVIVIGGPIAGGYTSLGQFGITTLNTCLTHGYAADQATAMVSNMSINNFVVQIIIFAVVYILCKGWKVKSNLNEPAKLTSVQKKNLILVIVSFGSMILISALKSLFPDSSAILLIAKFNDILFIIPVLIMAALLLKVGDPKEAFKRVPLNSIIMVCGISMLISVGLKGGIQESLTAWAAANVANAAAPYILVLAGAFMSYFVSTTSGVIPTLGTLVGGIVQGTAFHTCYLYSCICVPAGCTAFSPFSSGGGICLGSITDEKISQPLYKTLLWFPFVTIALNLVAALVGLYFVGPF